MVSQAQESCGLYEGESEGDEQKRSGSRSNVKADAAGFPKRCMKHQGGRQSSKVFGRVARYLAERSESGSISVE